MIDVYVTFGYIILELGDGNNMWNFFRHCLGPVHCIFSDCIKLFSLAAFLLLLNTVIV